MLLAFPRIVLIPVGIKPNRSRDKRNGQVAQA